MMRISATDVSEDLKRIPSSVTDVEWMSTGFPNTPKSGKWMIFLNAEFRHGDGLTLLDKAWLGALDLYEKGVIAGVSCTTAAAPRGGRDDAKSGVINLHTTDYNNIPDVKRAADAIRKVLNCRQAFFYKTTADTKSGKSRFSGSKDISLYLHTRKNQLLVKGEYGKWVEIDKKDGNASTPPPSSSTRREPKSVMDSSDDDDSSSGDGYF